MAQVVETRFRKGTVVCPDYPAAVNASMPTALVVAEPVLQAMRPLVPDKPIAEGSGSGAIALGGRARDGKRSYVQYEIFAGGVGGRNGKDGASATSFHLSNGKIAPVEIIESEFPTQVERFELLRDSGGPGRHRGGLGFVREYRILQDEVRFSMRTDKHALAPQGIDGGADITYIPSSMASCTWWPSWTGPPAACSLLATVQYPRCPLLHRRPHRSPGALRAA